MNLLKRLAGLFSGGGAPRADKRYLTIYVLSRRCNEPVSGQVDLLNELSKPDEGEYEYYTRKVLHTTGEKRCFSQVDVHLYFNKDKQVVHHEVEGGRWLTSEEYAAELARFNAPPPEDDIELESGNRTTNDQRTHAQRSQAGAAAMHAVAADQADAPGRDTSDRDTAETHSTDSDTSGSDSD
jgi:hypothetical protein